MIAAIRPDDWNFPLLLHVLGAMVLVGALIAASTALLLGWRRDAAPYTRLAFRTLLLAALPAYIVMRVGAQWTESKEGFEEGDEPAWLGVGYITADAGALLLLISIILTGIAARRLRTADRDSSLLTRIAGIIATVLVVAYVIAVWAMTTKPE